MSFSIAKHKNNFMQEAKILIIEDDIDIRESLADILTFEGHNIVTAGNGQEGLDYLNAHPKETPDLILLDLMMPIMDGDTFLENLESHLAHINIPIIILSAAICGKERENVVAFMKKPVDLDNLLKNIQKFTQRQRERTLHAI